MNSTNSVPWYRITKSASAWVLALVLGPVLLWTDRGLGSAFIALGLANIFFNPWRPDDERARALRIKAIASGFYASFGVIFLTTVMRRCLSENAVLRALRHEPPLPSPWGVWDAIILTLVLAQLLFWFWSYRDGMEAKPVTGWGWRRALHLWLHGR